jgi:hypothetical protein
VRCMKCKTARRFQKIEVTCSMVQGAAVGGQGEVGGGRGRAGGGRGRSGCCSGRQVVTWGGQRAAGGNREPQEAARGGKSHMMEVKAGGQLFGSFPILFSLDHQDLTAAAFPATPSTLAVGGQLGVSGWGHQM